MSSPKEPQLKGADYGPSIPPPPPSPSKSYNRRGHSGGSCNPFSCLCGCIFNLIFKIIFTVILIVVLIGFLFWLAFRPTAVKFHITNAALTQFNLTTNAGTSTLYYNLDVNLTIRNPNKHIGIYYNSIEARAFYYDQRFAIANVPQFYQGKKTTKELNVAFVGQNILVDQNGVSKYYSEKGSGIYSIDVKVYFRFRFKLRVIKTATYKPKIECDLKVPLEYNGKASGTFQTAKCGFKW